MSENRCSCSGAGAASSGGRETVCIDTYRVLDSCRDRDCYENVRVYLDATGQEIINRSGAGVRVSDSCILCTNIQVDPVQFNNGFYQITSRFYILVKLTACIGIGRSQEFEGICALDKTVVLYGGEGNASIFRSEGNGNRCIPCSAQRTANTPVAVIEAVEPVTLGSTVLDPRDTSCPCYCCCSSDEIPAELLEQNFISQIVDNTDGNRLYVSLGLFTVYRIERPAQYLISATDYSVPDKECVGGETSDPCSLFRSMAFPTGEFSGTSRTREDCTRR